MSDAQLTPMDSRALADMLDTDPAAVEKVAAEVAQLIEDPIIANSLAICQFCRRLSMIALTAVDRQLQLGTSNPGVAMRIIRETSRALRETGRFTVADLEAEAVDLLPPYFTGLAAATMFQLKVEENEHATIGDVVADLSKRNSARTERSDAFSRASGLGKSGKRKRKSGRRG